VRYIPIFLLHYVVVIYPVAILFRQPTTSKHARRMALCELYIRQNQLVIRNVVPDCTW